MSDNPDSESPRVDSDDAGPAATPPVVKQTVVKRGKRPWVLAGGLAAAIAALLYARCAGGLGFGRGTGEADERPPAATASDAQPTLPAKACELRLGPDGLHLDGAAITIEAVVARCKPVGKARLTVSGDSNYGELVELREALEAAGVDILGQ